MTEWLHFHFSLSCLGEGNGNPLQFSCLENPRDGGAWWAAIYGVAQSRTRLKRLSSSSSSDAGSNWKGIFTFVRNHQFVFHSDCHFAFPTAMNENSFCSISSLAFALVFGHPNRCIMAFHCFNLYFLMTCYAENLLIYLFSICMSSLWDVSVKFFG